MKGGVHYSVWRYIFALGAEYARDYKGLCALIPATPLPQHVQKFTVILRTWYTNGQSTVDGPAVITWHSDGQLQYEAHLIDGKYSKMDGPAIIWWYPDGQLESEYYWIDGKQSRLDGPAVRKWHPGGTLWYEDYWIDGVKFATREAWQLFKQAREAAKNKKRKE